MTNGNSYEQLIQRVDDPAFEQQQLVVSVLRSDLLHPVISGNKWMKLQPWFKKANETHTCHIISKGGPWSNHLHACAYTCFKEGLKFTAVVKAPPGFMTPTLNDLLQWKAKILYADHRQYLDESYWENLAFVQDALYVPMGGEGELAVQGVSAFFDQFKDRRFDHIICPVGTGTTMLGIAFSNIGYEYLIGVDPGIQDAHYNILLDDLAAQFPTKKFELLYDPGLKKFGKWPDSLPTQMNGWYRRWKLPTDIVYTAKMFAHFERLITENYFEKGKTILLVHTGGLQGNRSLPAEVLTF